MARRFNGSTDRADHNAGILTAAPLTLACWFYASSGTAEYTLISLPHNNTAADYFSLALRGDQVGDPVGFAARAGGAPAWANTTSGYSVNTWQHACGVAAAVNSRTVYLNGGSAGTNTTSITPPSINRVSIGVNGDITPAGFFPGRIAEVGLWNAALSEDEVLALSRGVSPRLIRPASLVAYYPLWGNHSPEIDLTKNARSMTLTGTSRADHAPVLPFSWALLR